MKQKFSTLYRHIEKLHNGQQWGSVLDTGTGANSARWISTLATESFTVVTGSDIEADIARKAVVDALRPQDEIIVGNWADADFFRGKKFDTVIADYLLGAIDGLSPYYQTYLFARLHSLTRNNLYFTGLEPYVPAARPNNEDERIVCEIGRFRDACTLLKGGKPYREYPSFWVVDQLKQAGYQVDGVTHFSIQYKDLFVRAQFNIALHKIDEI